MNAKWNLLVGLAGLALLTSGCLIIPTNEHDSGNARRNITKNTPSSFQPGVSTREDLLLVLGEPDAATSDESKFAYRAEKIVGYWIVFSNTSADGGPILRQRFLLVDFDPNGHLKSCEVSQRFWPRSPEKLLKAPVRE